MDKSIAKNKAKCRTTAINKVKSIYNAPPSLLKRFPKPLKMPLEI